MIDYSREFEGKKVLVTGGTKGIGAAIALRLREAGATVAVTARNADKKMSDEIKFIQGDVSSAEGCNKIASQIIEELGNLDILINNVGAASPQLKGIESISDDDWLNSLNINFMSAVRMTNPLLPLLRSSTSGVIVNISAGGLLPFYGFLAHYGAAKAALNSYTRSLAKELAKDGIRVNLVTPGAIATPGGDKGRELLTKGIGLSAEQLFKSVPLGRVGYTSEIAETIAFLVSDRSSYITGHNQFVTGGQGELS